MTARKEEKSVSWPLGLSIMSCFTQQLFTHSGVSSVSLSVSHLVCNSVSSFVIQSASLTVSRSSSLPVTQTRWISRSFASREVTVRLLTLTAFYSFINQWFRSISQSRIQKIWSVSCPFEKVQSNEQTAPSFLRALRSEHQNHRCQVADRQNNKQKLAITRLIHRVINRQTVSQSHPNTHTYTRTYPHTQVLCPRYSSI